MKQCLFLLHRLLPVSLLLLLFCGETLQAQQSLQFNGGSAATPVKVPGHKLYLHMLLPEQTDGKISVTFPLTQAGQRLFCYRNKVSDAQEATNVTYTGNSAQLKEILFDCVYFLQPASGTAEYHQFFYYPHFSLDGLVVQAAPSSANPCQWIELTVSSPIRSVIYRLPSGEQQALPRLLRFSYQDLVYNTEVQQFDRQERVHTVEAPGENNFTMVAPLADTPYTLLGDRFSDELGGSPQTTPSEPLPAQRLEVHTLYEIVKDATTIPRQGTDETGTGEKPDKSGELSAPCTLKMKMIANEPAAQTYQWRILRSAQKAPEAPVVLQYNGTSTEFTFTEAGSYTVVPTVSNRQTSCQVEGELFSLTIGNSLLSVPNAFSPFNSPGINDVFRVVHRSITRFHAAVFDEWGNRLHVWTDPNDGWDGTIHGRKASAGVYYYVITAQGADGKQYNLSGALHLMVGDSSTNQFQ